MKNKIMDKKLQKLILQIIKISNGVATWRHIVNKTTLNYWERNKQPAESNTIIKHQLDLLQKEDKVIRQDQLPDIFYILTPRGHQEFDSYWTKAWRFILYDRHNLFIILSIIVSVIALVISFFALKK